MDRLKIPAKTNTLFLAMIGLGVVCLGLSYVWGGDHHERFWSNLLLNGAFFTFISFVALFFYCANIIALSGWYTQFRRVWEAMSLFLIFGLCIMGLVGVAAMMGWAPLYHWSDAASLEADAILLGKSPFLNFKWYFLAIIGFGGIWYAVARRLRSLSLAEDLQGTMDYKHYRKMQVTAAFLLVFGGFTSAAAVWLWVMSVDAHWYSTLFAWYTCVSALVCVVALTILILMNLKRLGHFPTVTTEHFHDLGKYLFAFSIFWTYLWFSQYMLIWYANVGEETVYFKHRMDSYPVLFILNLGINFALPFLILLRNDTKRKQGTLTFVALVVILGHWLDYFLMIKPGVLHTAHAIGGHGHGHGDQGHAGDHGHGAVSAFVEGFTLPGLIDIGVFVGFLGFFLFVVYRGLAAANLEPKRDPYYEESLHHHV